MTNEYKATIKDGRLTVNPIIEKDKKGNVKIKVPSTNTIQKTIQKHLKENGKRNLQQI